MNRAIYDVVAPAKLNLFLHVVGKRADGYHLIQSLFVLIDWCDTLHFESRADGTLSRHDLGTPLPPDDLCLRAARVLQAASGTPFGADISIDKQVPSGAGMGGGSSDAASTLIALNRLWRLGWPRERLAALALQLGADVPFFVGGRNALAEGVGERLTPVEVPVQRFAVLKPSASIETRAIFASPLLGRTEPTAILESFTAHAGARQSEWHSELQREWHNDLQAAADAQCPPVGQALKLLHASFGNSRMTGSGSAVFAEAGSAALPTHWPADWAARMCTSLAAHPLVGWLGAE